MNTSIDATSNLGANAAAATAAILLGASLVAIHVIVREIQPLTLAVLRFGLGSLVLFAALAVFRRDLLRVAPRDIPYLTLLGALFFTIFPLTFNAGMQYIPASRGALIMATMPLWTLVLGRGVARERLTARQVAGVMISVAGVAAVLADRRATSSAFATGDLLIVATALCGAIYNVLAKRSVTQYGGVTVTFYAMILGTLLLMPLLLAQSAFGVRAWSRETLALLVFVGILGGALGFTLWTSALRRLSPTQVAVYINLNPLTATAIAATLLHERLSLRFVGGFLAVAAGVFIVNWTPAARRAALSSP